MFFYSWGLPSKYKGGEKRDEEITHVCEVDSHYRPGVMREEDLRELV